jgi:adenine-specific DNA-methyltransferase
MIPTTTETPQEVKARGAFYTPATIAAFIARWAIRAKGARVLEPACGDGSFMVAAAERLADLGAQDASGLVGVEKSAIEAAKASALVPVADVRRTSFFDVEPGDFRTRFDAVIGNPPYIRYHGFTGEDRDKGLARARAQGVQLTRLASSWAHFVVHATSFLAEDGRLGLVLPAELLVTDYAQPVRAHLLARFASVLVIAFDRLVFEDAQVDAVLLLASNEGPAGINVVRVLDVAELDTVDLGALAAGRQPGTRWSTSIDAGADEAYRALLDSGTVQRLSDVATVDIGIVTGANAYFILSQAEAAKARIPEMYLTPVVERPRDVPGLSVDPGELSRLVLIPPGKAPTDPAVARYLRAGKATGIPNGYKCRVRKHWYSVPLPKKRPHAFLPYMTGDVPRVIVNVHGSWSTNLLHGVTVREDAPDVRALSAAMLSSATLLSAEVEGRPYGGGVLKLETREAERLLVPRLSDPVAAILARLHPELDALVRKHRLDVASRIVDAVLGIDWEPLTTARLVFRTRRLERPKAGVSHRSDEAEPSR